MFITAGAFLLLSIATQGNPDKKCPDVCFHLPRPVCGTDGNTYENLCRLGTARCRSNGQVQLAHLGECRGKQHKICPDVCFNLERPVCGTDDKTYQNRCRLGVARCRSNGRIQIAYKGKCRAKKYEKCPEDCFPLADPVCGTDGKTYDNLCHLEIARCKSSGLVQPAYRGSCKVIQEKKCPDVCFHLPRPVCGTDGNTYENQCRLGIARCKSDGRVQLAYKGACRGVSITDNPCRKGCPKIRERVCGTNGKTYRNQCRLERAACKTKQSIKIKHSGRCVKS